MSINETKKDRFIRIVERRVNRILDNLESLGKCSNKKNYDYREEDVKKMFAEIEKKTREIRLLYRSSNEQKRKFRFGD